MSASETLEAVGKLLKQFPFIRCPRCGLRDEDGKGNPTFFQAVLTARVTVTLNEGTKTAERFRNDDPEFDWFTNDSVLLECHNCLTTFNLPQGWSFNSHA